jgi:type I restriction enzyme S subunit
MVNSVLPNGWQWSTLGEVAAPASRAIVSGPFGSNIGSRFFVAQGVPVIRGNNLTSDLTRFIDDGFVFVTEEKADELGNCEAISDDLVFTAAGSLGQVGIIPRTTPYRRYIISNKQLRARLNTRVIEPLFAFYWFASPVMVRYVQQRNTGSSVPLINLSVLRALPVPVPPLSEQQAIARILGTLDDKIDLNRRMSETLGGMVRAIFHAWFVNFEPVRSRIERRDTGLAPNISALFPNSFESVLGEIPKGWRVEPLSDVMTFEGGTQPPASEFISAPRTGYIRLVQIRDFYSGSHITYVPDTLKLRRFTRDDIMIARYGSSGNSSKGTDSLARVCRGLSGAYNVALVKVVSHRPIREFLGCFLRSPTFQSAIKGMGARSVQSGFRKEDLRVIPVVTASPGVHAAFERFAEGVWHRTLASDQQSCTLAALRDTLLPKLISGELRVKDAERAVEAVV